MKGENMEQHNERLQKVIAHSGVTSRRKAETMIEEGRVKVNGETVTTLGVKVTSSDRVEVDGVQLTKETRVYYLLYKPRGVISAVSDDKGRKVVTDLLPFVEERVYPVGRLDYDTSGLILLTNDGELAQLMMHPSYEMDKVYVAKIKGVPTKSELQQFKRGIKSEGDVLKAVSANIISINKEKQQSIIEVTLHEGKNRQVRRMFEALNYPVMKLKRERYGFLNLRGMTSGDFRELTPHEVKQLRAHALDQHK